MHRTPSTSAMDNAAALESTIFTVGAFNLSPQRHTLGVIIRTYKAAVTTACRSEQQDFAWQRGFYEQVVRHSRELEAIRRYIYENPLKWELDRDHPANMRRFPPATMADYLREAIA